MDAHFWIEAIGYTGSALVAISLAMRSLLRLRLINLIGALSFTVYGLLIHAYPVVGMNLLIMGIDLVYLAQMLRQKEYFTMQEVSPGSRYLHRFLEFHREDIRRFLPDFDTQPTEGQITFFILRDMVSAGLFIAQAQENGSSHILLDYVIPGYRDFKIGKFVLEENADFFHKRGIRRLVSPPGSKVHQAYLKRMGFHPLDKQTWMCAV